MSPRRRPGSRSCDRGESRAEIPAFAGMIHRVGSIDGHLGDDLGNQMAPDKEPADSETSETPLPFCRSEVFMLAQRCDSVARGFASVDCKRLLCAALPATWMPACMNYCHDDNLRLLDPEVDAKRKACHQCTACITMNYRVRERLFGHELESSKRLVQEVRARDPGVAARTMKQLQPDLDPPPP